MNRIFEDFLHYCEGSPLHDKLPEIIKSELLNYFDLPNKSKEWAVEETEWIANNLSEKTQREVLGKVLVTNKD